jgi:hypothetical protein
MKLLKNVITVIGLICGLIAAVLGVVTVNYQLQRARTDAEVGAITREHEIAQARHEAEKTSVEAQRAKSQPTAARNVDTSPHNMPPVEPEPKRKAPTQPELGNVREGTDPSEKPSRPPLDTADSPTPFVPTHKTPQRVNSITLLEGRQLTDWNSFCTMAGVPTESGFNIDDSGILICSGIPSGYIRGCPENESSIRSLPWQDLQHNVDG